MALLLKQSIAVNALAEVLYAFLPASGNSNTSFPLAARNSNLEKYWEHNSKLPAIVNFITLVLTHESNRLLPFIEEVVRQSVTWRGSRRDRCLTKEEIIKLNECLLKLGYRSPALSDEAFLDSFPRELGTEPQDTKGTASPAECFSPTETERKSLQRKLLEIAGLEPQPRGYAFEKFLNELFAQYRLIPKSSFRLSGEQIDGSIETISATYLVEAKWQNALTPQADLLIFRGKVDGKARWSRGLFISYTGFSESGLEAFSRGKETNIICMDAYDLHLILDGHIGLAEAISLKARKAAETNNCFVRVRDLV